MYYISSKTIFPNLQDLVEHYRGNFLIRFRFYINFSIVNVDGLCCLLTRPCRKIEPTLPADRYGLLELDRVQLTRTELVGKGNYGEVYKGKYGQRDVAIKCMKTDNKNRVSHVDKFLDEAKIMKDLLHKNIVRLYGVCTQEEPIFIVTEFMTNGCLLNYLRDGQGKTIKFKTILDFAAQVKT
jgi:serine/threonine protein kinase